MERFKLSKSTLYPNIWVCVDLHNQITCSFERGRFNETQKFNFDPNFCVGKTPNEVAGIVNQMAEWLRENHYNIAMPKVNIRTLLAHRIKDARDGKGWSQSELAERCGLSQPHINRIESAKYSMTIDVLDKVLEALDLDLDIKSNIVE